MDHLLEIVKVIEGALRHDQKKVHAYAQQLATKIEAAGDTRAAKEIRRALAAHQGANLEPARFTPARVPVDPESRLHLADEETVGPDELRPVLPADTEERVGEFVRFAQNVDKLIANGVGISPSLLLFGPPGNGKTALARRIAADLNLPLITARADALISSFLGSTAKNIRMLCEHAQSRPCVLFLDEIDALAKLRDDQHELGELKRVVVSLLQNLDALDSRTVILAATNHEHLLDPALWRRFAYKIRIDPPDRQARASLFANFLGALIEAKYARVFASVTEGMSGADIKQICDDVKREAVIGGLGQVTDVAVLRRILLSIAPESRKAGESAKARVRAARAANAKVFTVRRLAAIFGLSTGAVWAVLNKEQKDG